MAKVTTFRFLPLSRAELEFIIRSVDGRRPFCYEIEAGEKDALMWVQVMGKLDDALCGRQKTLEGAHG